MAKAKKDALQRSQARKLPPKQRKPSVGPVDTRLIGHQELSGDRALRSEGKKRGQRRRATVEQVRLVSLTSDNLDFIHCSQSNG